MVLLDNKVVRSRYLSVFFKSEFGKESIKSMVTGGVIPHLNLSSVSNIKVTVPSIEEQDKIVEFVEKLNSIKLKIKEIEDKLALNPIDDEQGKIIDNILLSVNNLSLKVSPLLCEESITHEFKASFRTPYPSYPEPYVNDKGQKEYEIRKVVFNSKNQIHTYFEFFVLKTIVSFLNTRGGTLVIGVHEYENKKKLVGIDREEFDSNDHYERHLIQKLNNAFNPVIVSKYISVEILKIDGVSVCVIKCKEDTGDEIFYLDDIVYIRTGPRIDQLSTKEVVELSKIKSKN